MHVVGEPRCDRIPVRHRRPVGHVHGGDLGVLCRTAPGEPPRQVRAVLLRGVHRHATGGSLTSPEGVGERADVGVGLRLDLQPVVAGVHGGPALHLRPLLAIAPPPAGFGQALGEPWGTEDLELLRRGERDPRLPCLQLPCDGAEQRLGALLALPQQVMLPAQVVVGAGPGFGEDLGDVAEPEPQLPVEQDLPQALQILFGVAAVVRGAAPGGGQEPYLVVVVQGAHGDSRQLGEITHRVGPWIRRPHRPAPGVLAHGRARGRAAPAPGRRSGDRG